MKVTHLIHNQYYISPKSNLDRKERIRKYKESKIPSLKKRSNFLREQKSGKIEPIKFLTEELLLNKTILSMPLQVAQISKLNICDFPFISYVCGPHTCIYPFILL